jgi:uncharacterized protein YbbC (DUF1343 family)
MNKLIITLVLLLTFYSCHSTGNKQVLPGANQLSEYLCLIKGKRVALVVNHTSQVEGSHLVDTLLGHKVIIKKIFTPEHGFRGEKDAGEIVHSQIDDQTGIPIISLYGKNKKPTPDKFADIDIVLFDIQDVGVRFYTYISTMHYVMEACAESNTPLLILDRPNPNGDYIAGPVLKDQFKSFVGMHPIPIVHGLTVGELALMINGEGWLKNGAKCSLKIIMIKNWDHTHKYELPVKPSPNLPNYQSVRLYPSLCFFEATQVSVGRGTYFPFQVIGYPDERAGSFTFTPRSIEGMAKNPKQKDQVCFGHDLRELKEVPEFTLSYFIAFYTKFGKYEGFKLDERWFNLLAGTDELISGIKLGLTEDQISAKWQAELANYSQLRKKYLLYP